MTDQSGAPGILIILGRPGQDMLETRLDHLGALPGRVVVVDPQADTVLPGQPGVERIPALVSQADGAAELSTYSVAGLRSLTPPTAALAALFPRLRTGDRQPVQLMSVENLLARLGPLPDPLQIWIDMPGQETALLQGLQAAGVLDRAEGLVIRCGVESFFEGADDSAAVQSWLEPAAFDLAGLDQTDPDWPDMYFRPNAMARQLSALKSRSAAQQDELNAAQKALEAGETEKAALAKERADLRRRVSTLEAELKAARQGAETSRQALEAGETEKASLDTERADLRRRVSTLEAELKAARQGAETSRQALEAGETEKASLDTERADLRRRVSTLEDDLKAAEAARSDLGFQIRLKEMQKLDLDNLRQRFEDSEQRRRQQEELLLKLTPRLSQASEQLRQLQQVADTGAFAIPGTGLAEAQIELNPDATREALKKAPGKKKVPRKSQSKRSKKV